MKSKGSAIMVSLVFVLLLVAAVGPLSAAWPPSAPQATPLAQQSLRPYVNVFIAYAIALLAVLGWVISIGRRLARLERRLGE